MIRFLRKVFRPLEKGAVESKLEFEAVEPRVLFSATAVDPTETSGEAHHTLPQAQDEAPAYTPARSEAPDVVVPQVAGGDGALLLDGLNAYAPEMAAEGRREIVFISTDVEDYEYIVSNLDASYEVFLIDSESDGLAQMAAALEGIEGVDAIHLLTHGSEGRLFLGGAEVNAESIDGVHRGYLEAIRNALSEDADFLIYGCDFTSGEQGLATAELLFSVLGADIAASTNGTGHEDLGGDWDLETELGLIESEMLSLEGWNGLLAPISIVNTNNATTLANNIIGSGISLGTATYTGSAAQAGTFTSATGYTPEWLGYSSGIILTTGATSQVLGPNSNGGASVDAPVTGADADLAALGGGNSFDASVLSFTFTPTSNRITMQFTFGSDEYNEYVYSAFNDAMGVWVNGVQVAVTPTGGPVSVNSINQAGTYNPANGVLTNDPNPANGVFDSSNPNLYINNPPNSGSYNTGMDGFTVTLSFVANVNIGVSNTIKIGIADIGDAQWDSWLFIREDSLTASTLAVTDYVATAVSTPVVINALANDWDSNGDPLTITHVLDKPISVGGPAVILPSGSTVVLNANGTLTFTPVSGSTTDEIFTYTISDGTGSTAVGYIHVDINQTPVNIVPVAQTTTEDTSRVISGLAVADVDSTALTTTLALPAGAGTITVTTGGGAAISGNGSGSVTLSGTAAQINAAIASITYAPAADFNTGSPAVPINLTVATTDGISTDTDTVAITVTPVADIVADTVSTTEDTAVVFNAILGTNGASADNFENAGRVVSAVTQGTNGSVTFLANGQITYTPNLNFFGTDSFAYTVTSGGVTETATVTVNVAAVNDVPVNTVPAAQVATEDTNRIITGVSIADVDSASLTTTLSIPAGRGTLSVLTGGGATITGNGTASVIVSGTAAQINAAIASITYVPLADYNTATAFNLTVQTTDGSLVDTDTVAITVNAVADIFADTVSTNEDTAVVFNAITGTNGASADNFENAGRAITSVTQGTNGAATFLANGQITYTPNLNFFGTDSFTYTVTSGGVTETATVTVNVTGVNDAPVNTVPAAQVATEDTNRIITGVSIADVDNTSLSTTLSIPAGRGTLAVLTGGGAAITGNGTATVVVSGTAAQINAAIASITYAPLADFNTATAFNLTVATSDGALTDTDTVAITVNAVADIVADTVSTNEDTAIIFNAITGSNGASADNFENGGRAITSVTQGANGSVTFLANGQITYTPNAHFFGTDSFTYTVTSGGVTETATVTVNVAAVNDAPVNTVPAAQVATEDTNRVITGVSIADVDSISLTTTLSIPGTTGTLSILTGGGATISGNGTATVIVSGTASQINAAIASITYVPLADFNTATSFNLTVATSDGTLTDTDTVAITVNAVADIVADTVSTNEDTAVVFNAITGTNGASADNFENAGRAITSVNQGANGSVSFLANGQITYTPNANFFGTDSFSYTVTSGGVIETATVTVNVAAVNDAPDAVDDDFAAGENDGPVVLGNAITSNDSDIDGDDLVAVVQTGVAGSAGGLFSINEDGVATFDANGEFEDLAAGETRETNFTYTIEDGMGGTDTATVTVTVSGANDAPVVTGLIGTQWNEDSESVSIDLSGFFSDADSSDDLTYTATGLPAGLSLDPDTGLLSGTIASSASAGGPYTVEVTVNDGNGGLITQTFTWNVFNPEPVATNDDFAAGEDDPAAVVGNVLINDGDPDNDALSAQVTSGGGSNGGQFTIAANGAVTFDADGDFDDLAVGETRETTFTYTLVDADGATSPAVITVTVAGANDAPLVVAGNTDRTDADSATVSLDTSVYFYDIDGSDVLTYTATGLPDGLSVDAATGIISGTIDASASVGGPYSVEVIANDGNGGTISQFFTWVVNNPAPIAVDDAFTVNEDDTSAVIGNVITASDSDPDGDIIATVVQSGVAGSAGGLFSISATGEVSFDPNGAFENLAAGESRETTFTYTLVDADGATSTAVVAVTVEGSNDTPVTVGTIPTLDNDDSDAVSLDVSRFFTDTDSSDVLEFSASGLPDGLSIDSATGIISGTIDSSASTGGPYTVVVTADDGNGGTTTQIFTWNVSNPGPLAEYDGFASGESTSGVVGNALTNDSDPDIDDLTALVASGVAGTNGGLFSIAANGEVSFDPNGEFEDLAVGETRTTSFTYTLVDADGAMSTATVTVTVTGENDAPVTVGTTADLSNDDSDVVTLDLSGYFTDADGSDILTYTATGLPAGLSIDESTGIISGTIDSSASAGGPYTVIVIANDGNGGTVSQTFSWSVNNPAPVAVDDAFAAGEDDAASIVGNVISGSDSDPDGDTIVVTSQSGVAGSNGGLFSVTADGDVSFDPNGQFEDLAAGETRTTSFTYTLVDADGANDTATVTVTVTGVNDAPVTVGTIAAQSNADSDSVSLDVSGLFADTDATDVLEFSATGLPAGLTIDSATGLISGTIASSASAGSPYTVEITVSDGKGGSVSQNFTWTVSNPAPLAVDDFFTAVADDNAAIVGNVISASDSDPDGDTIAVTAVTGVAGSNGGLFSIAANGDLTFDPNGQFDDLAVGETRTTSFTYTLVDADGQTGTALITVTVTGVNETPVANGTIADQSHEDSEAITPLDVSGYFSDVDSIDTLTYSVSGLPDGLVIGANTGIISGTLDSSASAGSPHTVIVTANDGSGGTASHIFTWVVTNPGPVAVDDAFGAFEDDNAIVVGNAITSGDSDPDGDTLSALVLNNVAGSNGGLFSIAANGEVTFDANGDFESLAAGETVQTSFTYTLIDADGATATATIVVTVTGNNDAPFTVGTIADQANDDSDTVSVDVSGFFGDTDGSDVFVFSATDLPAGLVIDETTGVISGRIDSSASAGGPYIVVVTATDSSGSSTSQNFTWNVSNPGPVADDDGFAADEDDSAAVVGNVLVNDSDVDGDALSVVAASGVTGSNGGIFSVSSTGEVTFDPNGAFESLALGETAVSTFTYTLVDADGATSTAMVTVTITGLNDAPDRVGSIAAQTSADSDSVLLDVSGSFSDADATDELEFSATGLPAGLVIDAVTGVISGTIDSSASVGGPYTVIVTATDGQGAAITQTFSWTVTNPAPIAGDDFFNATEDDAAAIVGNALTNNDSDPDSDALETVVLNNVAGSNGGLFSIAANGEVTFDPSGQFGDLAAGEIRQTSFTYTLVDADGATSTATVTVDVAGANDAPITVGTITTQNSLDSDVISLGTVGFFSDPDTTDVLTYSATGLPVGLTIDAATGVISGTIDSSASASGSYTVEVTATDEDGSAITQTFTWNVTNPGPVANNDNFTAVEDVVGTVGNVITNNDTDPDNDALSVVAQIGVSGSDGGVFSIAANGEVSFDPNGEFDDLAFGESRTTSLTYTLVDADGATSTAMVTITVNGANSAPFTVGTVPTKNNDDDDSVSLDLSGYFDDLDGSDALEFSATGLPGGLTIDAATGVISGTIDSSASAAGPYTVEVTVIDGNGGTVSLNFTWNVTNPAPVAVDDAFVADEDDSTAVVGNVIVGSDSDPDGDSLAVQVVNLVAGSEGGLFSIAANGDVTFDPNGEFEDLAAGESRETSLTYTLVDADGATSTATVTITVTGANDAPVTVGTVAAQSSIDGETIAPINLAVHFDDVDHGAVLSYSATGLPTGLVIDSVTGIISGTIHSSASQDGPFNVIITASDGLGGSVTQSFVWTVTNPGPVANDDAFTALEDSGLTVVGNAITNNDSDPDNDALSAVAGTNIAGSEGGLFSIAANGEVSFDPNGEFEDLADGETRETSFTYTLVDADGATTTATVTVTVTGANDAPVSVGSITTQSSVDSAVISLATSAFFADADASDVPSYSATGLPTGLVIDGTTGVISGTIDSSASVAGPYTVVVTMADGNGGSTTQTFSWIVSNPAPLAQDDTFTALEDDAAAVVGNAITNNDSDPDSDALTAVVATGVAGSDGGLFSINAAGEVSFDANGDFEDLAAGETRTTTFTYTVVDADGASSQATVTVEVTGENDAPENVAVIGTQVSEDSDVVTLDVSVFFSDKDLSDTLSYTATGLPAGLVIDAATGIISGTTDSSASQDGPFSVSVTAADGESGSITQTFTWTVSNPAPIANDDAFGVSEDDSLAVIGNVITAGDSDPDGDSLSVVAGSNIAGSHGGLFSIAANGDVSFDPNCAFEDLATGETRTTSFTYTLVDADGATATATVTVTVTGMNDAPTTVGSIATRSNADSDVIAPLDVTGFFADADLTDVMEYSATGLPSGLTIDAATGIISGMIASSASTGGPYSVTLTASDGNGGSVEQIFTWMVSNPAPNAVNDTYGIGEDDAATVLGNVTGNDGDPDGDALSVVAVSGAAGSEGGLFTINGTGEVSFDPSGAFEDLAAGETRETSYTYTLVDADGATSQATVTVTVTGSNDAPVRISSIPAQVSEDSDAVMLNVSGAFGDMDASDELRYSASGLPAGLSINEETGVISGTIDSSASASGPYAVVVTVDDNHGGTTTQTFTWTVTNLGPVAVDDSFVADEDDATAIVGNAITGSDTDPDGDAISAQVQSGVAGSHGGLFSIAANGDVTFDPNGAFEDLAAGETRETSFVYTLTDADGATTSATVTVTVTGENDAPVGTGSIATRNSIDGEIISLDLSGFFSDPDVSDVLSYGATGLPAGLTIDSVTGIISGTIETSASAAGPYTAMVTAQDASGMFVSLSFTWNVTNPVPVAQGDAFAAGEDDASLVVGNVLGNDSDPDNDTLTVVPVNQLAGSAGGLFTIDAAGNVTFTPNGNFEDLAAGETRETSVNYTLVDADGATVTATIKVDVTGANDAPVLILVLPNQSHQDSASIVPINTAVAFADADAGDSLVYSVSGLPAGLSFDINTGIISGTLHSSASLGGPYLVHVTATDETGESVTASFTWTVTNPTPVANNDQSSGGLGLGIGLLGFGGAGNDRFSAAENDLGAIVGNALDNDLDPDGDDLSAVAESNISGSHGGIFSIATNGEVTFDPAGQFEDLAMGETRETSFTYTIVDADGGAATAVVTVKVTGSNDAPLVTSLISDQEDADDTLVGLDASEFFGDPDLSDTLRFSATGLPSGLTINEETGVISGTIDHDASGDGPFTVEITATDENGEKVTISFVWTVTNPAPVAVNDHFSVNGTAATVALGNVIAGGDSDPDGDALTVVPQSDIAGTGGGLFHLDAAGNVTFDPNGAFANLLGGQSRETSFTYTLIDADGASSTATVTVKVTAANAPPVPQSEVIRVDAGTRGESLGLRAPVDPDGDVVTITVTKLPKKGVLRLPNGKAVSRGQVLSASQLANLVFDAPENYKGKKPVIFRYKVTDGQVTSHAKVKIKILKGNLTVTCYSVTQKK